MPKKGTKGAKKEKKTDEEVKEEVTSFCGSFFKYLNSAKSTREVDFLFCCASVFKLLLLVR